MTTEKKTVADHFPGKTSDEIADILTNKDFQAEEEARKTAGQKAVEHALDPERTPEDMEALDLEVENRKLPPTGPRVSLRPAFPPWDPPVVPFTKEELLRGRVPTPDQAHYSAPKGAGKDGPRIVGKVVDGKMVLNPGEER